MEVTDILDLATELISLKRPEAYSEDIRVLPLLRSKAAKHISKHDLEEVVPMVTSKTCIQHGIIHGVSADGAWYKMACIHDCFQTFCREIQTNDKEDQG